MKKEKQFLTEYIKLYRSFPCLWKINSKEYSDRNVKSQAYEIIIEKMQEFDQNSIFLKFSIVVYNYLINEADSFTNIHTVKFFQILLTLLT
ncbi:hypothetical protein RN001_009594 [Aquatica leii]|uniref:MADF domain-containing protein n=1 Tax=Aquatica leii TaxID=1421715 RepID=A0AAN7P6V3_9COLE|nr:hypothetical protein RN001_009594 [Aquatica leii]